MIQFYDYITGSSSSSSSSTSSSVIVVRTARWCTTSDAEQRKCNAIASVFNNQNYPDAYVLNCVQGIDNINCMDLIRLDLADLISLDAGLAYVGGEQFTLKPLYAEDYTGSL